MGFTQLYIIMKGHIILPALVFLCEIASANILIESDEAKQILRSRRQKRSINLGGFTRWSNVEKECFRKEVCSDFEEFAEGAENIWGHEFIKEDRRTQDAFNNLYSACHENDRYCRKKANSCDCNEQFKKWLENPSDQIDTTIKPATTESTTIKSTTTESVTPEPTTTFSVNDNRTGTECMGYFCETASTAEPDIKK